MSDAEEGVPDRGLRQKGYGEEPEGQVRQADQVRGQPQRHRDPREMPRQRTMHQPVQPGIDGGAEVRVEPPLGILSRVRARGAQTPPAANDACAARGERPAQGVACGGARGHVRLDRGQERRIGEDHGRLGRTGGEHGHGRERPAARGAPWAARPRWPGARASGSSGAPLIVPVQPHRMARARAERPMARSTSVPRNTAGTATNGQPAWSALISARNATGSPATSRRPASASSGEAR